MLAHLRMIKLVMFLQKLIPLDNISTRNFVRKKQRLQMCVDSLHNCHQVVKNVQETKVMLSHAYGGKLSITGCGQNNKIILYRFLLCLMGEAPQSLGSVARISIQWLQQLGFQLVYLIKLNGFRFHKSLFLLLSLGPAQPALPKFREPLIRSNQCKWGKEERKGAQV